MRVFVCIYSYRLCNSILIRLGLFLLQDRDFGKVTKTRSKKPRKERQQSQLLLVSSESDEAEDDILSMAMIKEKQRDKCGSVEKRVKTNSGGSAIPNNDNIKSEILENDIDIKDESFRIADDIMEKVSSSSPASVACSFADPKNFVSMDICQVDREYTNFLSFTLSPLPLPLPIHPGKVRG